jgi:hypothetical protein
MTRSRSRGRSRSRSRNYRGGASYSDAQSYMLSTVGGSDAQYNNVFRQGGMNHSQSNAIINQNTGQQAGGRRMIKRGGSWVSDAVVPAALLAGTYLYSRRRGNKSSYRKRSFKRRR